MNVPFISPRETKKNIFHEWLRFVTHEMYICASLEVINGILIQKNKYSLYTLKLQKCPYLT